MCTRVEGAYHPSPNPYPNPNPNPNPNPKPKPDPNPNPDPKPKPKPNQEHTDNMIRALVRTTTEAKVADPALAR